MQQINCMGFELWNTKHLPTFSLCFFASLQSVSFSILRFMNVFHKLKTLKMYHLPRDNIQIRLSFSFQNSNWHTPSSLMDSIVSLKVKIVEGKRVELCSLTHSTSGVGGHDGTLRWDQDKRQVIQLFTRTYTNQTTSWLVHSRSTFITQTHHGQTRTHKIHHCSNLGEATTFSFIVLSMHGHRTNTQMSFCFRIPKWKSRNS